MISPRLAAPFHEEELRERRVQESGKAIEQGVATEQEGL
jgi:hypothetical protein